MATASFTKAFSVDEKVADEFVKVMSSTSSKHLTVPEDFKSQFTNVSVVSNMLLRALKKWETIYFYL